VKVGRGRNCLQCVFRTWSPVRHPAPVDACSQATGVVSFTTFRTLRFSERSGVSHIKSNEPSLHK